MSLRGVVGALGDCDREVFSNFAASARRWESEVVGDEAFREGAPSCCFEGVEASDKCPRHSLRPDFFSEPKFKHPDTAHFLSLEEEAYNARCAAQQ